MVADAKAQREPALPGDRVLRFDLQVDRRSIKQWAGIPAAHFYHLPNCIDLESYSPGPKREDLVRRYGLGGRTVILTAGRLDERSKGFDEVMEALPKLVDDLPNAIHMIMGDGDDRARLEGKARALGVADRIIFTGYVPQFEKSDHYRLADVVAMPGSSPVFDRYPFRFAFLEPLACGIPVVGARLGDPTERDDPDANQLVIQVDPKDSEDITRGILEALSRGNRKVNPALLKFSWPEFERKAHAIVDNVLAMRT